MCGDVRVFTGVGITAVCWDSICLDANQSKLLLTQVFGQLIMRQFVTEPHQQGKVVSRKLLPGFQNSGMNARLS